MAVLDSVKPLVLLVSRGWGGHSSNAARKWFGRKSWDGNTTTAEPDTA